MALRAIHPDDAEAVYALVDQSREHLRAWLPWVDASRSAVYTREFFEHVVEQRERQTTAAYLILERGRISGMIGLHDIEWTNRSFLIGYWVTARAQGRGLITRACRALVDVAFEEWDLERAVIQCGVGNQRSSAVARRLGFTLEGIARHAQLLHGEFIDLEIWSQLRAERAL
ncbi:MAG: GNAT family N-acetyltransferase [Bryobacteraceae bacterium]